MYPEILIDGLNVFMRHYIANPSVSLNNQQCGGIVGFLRNIQHLAEKFQPYKITIAWEGGGSQRRRSISENYKAGRRPSKLNRSGYYSDLYDTKDNRDNQLAILIEILKSIPVTQIYVNDCEADDIIGYLCKNKKQQEQKIIVTSDKDYYQLIDDSNKIWSPNQKKLIDKDIVLEKSGISAVNYCTARCFIGDQSDGIKGVKGAGFKTMLKFFPELASEDFVSVDNIIEKAKQIESKSKLISEIISNANKIGVNWKLMYLDAACLSWSQINSIKNQYDAEVKRANKMDLMRVMIREGLNNFDTSNLLFAVNATLNRKINV